MTICKESGARHLIEKVFHMLTGYAQFEIRGDSARFLNVAAKSGFSLWGFGRREGTATAWCRAREYRRLRPLARRCHVRLKWIKKGGTPFLTRRMWKRKGLWIGAVCGAGIYFFLSGFVWGVSVSGTDRLTDRQVLRAAAASGVFQGTSKSGLDPKLSSRGIVAALPGLRWATVNTDGCFVEVVVSEAAPKPEITDDSRWSNIVATRPGTVRAVNAEHGRPEVKPGDTVEEGDLLISGLYQEKLEPWDPRAEHPFQATGAARGSVIAETYREFTVQVSRVRRDKVPTGEKRQNLALTLFGLRIPLGLNTVPEGEARVFREKKVLTALGVPLPLSVERTVYRFTQKRERTLSEEELREAAVLKLREAQRLQIAPGGRVVKEELEFQFPDGMCVLRAKCRCEEEIGENRMILVKATENEENFWE